MRLLFVANRMPYPPYRGDKLKIYNLGKALRENHEIHLVTIAETFEDIQSAKELEAVFHSVEFIYIPKWKSKWNVLKAIFSKIPFQIAYFNSVAFKKLIDLKTENTHFDAVHVQHLRMSPFINPTLKNKAILDLPDAFSLYWKRRYESSSNGLIKFFNKLEYKRLYFFEKAIIPQFPMALVCSKEDQRYLNETESANVKLLPNGVDTVTFSPMDIDYTPNRILFTGNMDYAPNIDAAEYFVNEIFPLILEKVPEAVFVIAGQRPVSRVTNLAADNVLITGFIPVLSEEYAKAHVVVSPLRIGAGTQNKVLEALAMNIPVVTSYVGYEGLELPPDVGALPSSNVDEFAHNVIRLLQNKELREEIGTKGGAHIRRRFSWPSVAHQLEQYLSEISIQQS